LPAIGGGLPSIGGRGGNFMMDDAYMRKAKQELNKLNEIADFDSSMAAKK
jgi:hypothetical protein